MVLSIGGERSAARTAWYIRTKKLIHQDDQVRATAVENSHYASKRIDRQSYGELKSYAYRFETTDRTIVVTGDAGPSDAVADLALGPDILVSEVINIDLITAFLKQSFNATDHQLQPTMEHMKIEHMTPGEVGKLVAKRRGATVQGSGRCGARSRSVVIRLTTRDFGI
jgi:ribonuclease BN (tRNA processing enzyme)